jgi:RNA polymerase sigma factor (sigma-70 family)
LGAEPDATSESRMFAALDSALGNLEPEERHLIDCRYFKREPLGTIAVRCGTTARAIEGRLARIRARLRSNITSALRQENL